MWLIVFLGTLVGAMCVLIFWMLLKFAVQEGENKRSRQETQKATMLLREERERFERLLKTVQDTEKGKE